MAPWVSEKLMAEKKNIFLIQLVFYSLSLLKGHLRIITCLIFFPYKFAQKLRLEGKSNSKHCYRKKDGAKSCLFLGQNIPV